MVDEVEGFLALVIILPILLIVGDGLLSLAIWAVIIGGAWMVRRKTYGM